MIIMLLIIFSNKGQYVSSINSLNEQDISDTIERLLHNTFLHNIDGDEAILNKSYELYEDQFVDDPGDCEPDTIGKFMITDKSIFYDRSDTCTFI